MIVDPPGDAFSNHLSFAGGAVVFAEDSGSFFLGSNLDINTFARALYRTDKNGALLWRRAFTEFKSAIIDDVEGTEWQGRFGIASDGLNALLAHEDGFLIAGAYGNVYRYGSSPPPNAAVLYVARLDEDGEQLWFQEYAVPMGGADYRILGIAHDAERNVIVALGNGMLALFKLSAENGTVLPEFQP